MKWTGFPVDGEVLVFKRYLTLLNELGFEFSEIGPFSVNGS